jgi:ATP-dependent helicase/nuclease subunit A
MERNGHIEDDALDAWCDELAQGEVLVDATGAGRLAAGMIRKFRESPRAQQLAKAKKSFREIEFLLAWPPEGGASGRYFRGFIDCLYEDQAGDWRVLDYKTNNISPALCESTAKKYELQMAVYGLAVEAALKRPPAELVLCFLRPGVEYALPWNPSVRAEAIEMVNQAIERFVSK